MTARRYIELNVEDITPMSMTIRTESQTTRQAGHSDVVTSVAFSPDGKNLASGGWDGTIKIWEVRGGSLKLRKTLRGAWDEVEAVAFAPDGSAIAGLGTGFDDAPIGVVTLWSREGGKGRSLIRDPGKLDTIAFSPDGLTLATGSGDSRSVMLRDVASGQVTATLPDHRGPILSVAYAPSGRLLASGTGKVPSRVDPEGMERDCEIRLWDLSGSESISRTSLIGHQHGVSAVAFSRDGSALASGGFDRVAKVWDVATGREWATFLGHEGWIAAVAFSPDGSVLATGSHDRTIRLWETTTGKELTVLRGHTGNVYSVAFSPDGRLLASGSLDGSVRLWEMSQALGRGQLQA